ncbi:MAG: hypothetical protein K0R17_1998 [Rariglobus sp.]|jgi:hypothetical protein|nr:hypothetical protein [Rariglobus sp.]
MNPTPALPVLAVTSALLFAALTPANADDVTLTTSNTMSGQSGFITASHWSNNQLPSAANDYFVNAGVTLRTPQASAATNVFGGNSLTINGGILGMANLQDGNNTTINNLTFTGGAAVQNTTSSLKILSGTLAITGSAFARLNAADTTGRNITIASQISGNGSMHVLQTGTLALTGIGNTFSGTWTAGGAATVVGVGYSNTALRVSTLDAFSAGSLGINSSLIANNHSIIKIGYDWTTTGSLSLNANSVLFLEHDLAVGELSIAGSSLDDGTYTYDYLNTTYAGFFNTTGLEGSITVGAIPEPSAYAMLLGASALGLVIGRRRRR